MRMRLSEIATCLGIPGALPDIEIIGAKTDHRQCSKGDIFVCIEGERVDGHDFAPAALANGALAVIAQKDLPDLHAPVLKVDNCIRALGRLAAYWRSKSGAKVIGITGTAGKTTLKDALACMLAQNGTVAITEKNHNNQIGLPCSILSASGEEDWWIMEAGISHEGDMQELGEILRPDLAIILNAASGHVEGLGKKGVAWHKSRLFEYLNEGGLALASADYPDLRQECEKLPLDINYFSIKEPNTPWHLLEKGQKGRYSFRLPNGMATFQTPFLGDFGAETALAAVAAADILGLDTQSMQDGFANCVMPEQRFNLKSQSSWIIIDDTYNANPLSMSRMLMAAKEEAQGGKLFLVLGEMGELGEESGTRHRELGKTCAALEPSAIFWHGGYMDDIIAGLQEGEFGLDMFFPIKDESDFISQWRKASGRIAGLAEGGTAFFKGSRSNKMERFLEAFEKMNSRSGGEADAL